MVAAKQSKGERTAEKILEATAHCIATYGIEKSSITRISKSAKVSRALVAHYFPNKSKIFIQVIQHIAQKAYVAIATTGPVAGDPRKNLEASLRANMNFFFSNPNYMKCFVLFYYFCGLDKNCRRLNTELTRIGRARIEADLKAMGIKDSEKAKSIHSKLVGAILLYYAVDENMNPDVYLANFLKQIRSEL
jgi:AcrR family transcriptional regulator